MNGLKVTIFTLGLIVMIAAGASGETNTAGAPLTVNDSDQVFTFTPSPGVLLNLNTSSSSYALTGVSNQVDASSGYQYGIVAGSSPIYQRAANEDKTLTAPVSDTSLGDGWADKAGNTAP